MKGSADNSDITDEPAQLPTTASVSREGNTGAFASYITALRGDPLQAPRIRGTDLVAAIIASLVALASVFSPWIRYISLRGTEKFVPGYKTDGVFLAVTAAVAMGALLIAWRRGPGNGDVEAVTALAASVAGILTVALTAMYLESQAIDDASGREAVRAARGLYAGGVASGIAAYFSYRAKRSVALY